MGVMTVLMAHPAGFLGGVRASQTPPASTSDVDSFWCRSNLNRKGGLLNCSQLSSPFLFLTKQPFLHCRILTHKPSVGPWGPVSKAGD